MTISVRVPAALKVVTGGAVVLVVDIADGATIADLLDRLGGDYPALERRLRDEQGAIRTHVNLFVGDVNIRELGGTAALVPDGSEVSVIAAVSGGTAPAPRSAHPY